MSSGDHRSSLKTELYEIYQSRSILFSLVRKDLIGKYKNSALGFLWHFLIPLMMLIVYYVTFVVGIRVAPIDNFVIYLASGLFPFTFMTSNLSGGAGCITGNSGMVKKMYFPREILVLSHVISEFIIMLIGYIVIFILIVVTGFDIKMTALTIIPIFMLMFVFVIGYTFLFSELNVYVHDVQYFLSSITMVFMFLTPMYFTVTDLQGSLQALIWLNPFTYFVEAFHSAIYFGNIPSLKVWIGCIILPTISLILGLIVFHKLKKGFAERL